MIHYNPKDWFGLIFHFHKSDTFRTLFWVIVSVALYSTLVVYLEREVFETTFSTSVMHSLLGFVISLLLVFRTNTAYERWWEGRKQWGALVNVARNYSFKIRNFVNDEEAQERMIRLNALYPYALKEHLRIADYALLPPGIQAEITEIAGAKQHVPNAIALKMQSELHACEVSFAQELAMIEDIERFTNICGACERIKKTPIPYNYNIFIKKFIFAYILTMPIGFGASFGYWTVLASSFTFYTLASLELIAESIEDPFGLDTDDLPTDELAETIDNNLKEV
ncbi:MAG: bestrophin family protein [Cryomorphaceae bacterium]